MVIFSSNPDVKGVPALCCWLTIWWIDVLFRRVYCTLSRLNGSWHQHTVMGRPRLKSLPLEKHTSQTAPGRWRKTECEGSRKASLPKSFGCNHFNKTAPSTATNSIPIRMQPVQQSLPLPHWPLQSQETLHNPNKWQMNKPMVSHDRRRPTTTKSLNVTETGLKHQLIGPRKAWAGL